MNQARLPGVNGTPSFVIGAFMGPGMAPLNELPRMMAEARGGQ